MKKSAAGNFFEAGVAKRYGRFDGPSLPRAIRSDFLSRARVRSRETAKTRDAVRKRRSICPCSPSTRESRGRTLYPAPGGLAGLVRSTRQHTSRNPLGRSRKARCLHHRSEPQRRYDVHAPDDRFQQDLHHNPNTASRLELQVERSRSGNGSRSSSTSVPLQVSLEMGSGRYTLPDRPLHKRYRRVRNGVGAFR